MRTVRFLLLAGWGVTGPLLADQTGAELTKKPVSAAIMDARKLVSWSNENAPVGNVEVTYTDGSKDKWTTLATALQPKVAPDGMVGWIDATEQKNGSKALALHRGTPLGSRVTLCDHGRVIRLKAALPYIEQWMFHPDGRHVVILSRSSHGPGTVQRFVRADGTPAGEVSCYESKVPEWAKPLENE